MEYGRAFMAFIIPVETTAHLAVYDAEGRGILYESFEVKSYGDTISVNCSKWEAGLYQAEIEISGYRFIRVITIERSPNIWQRLFNLQ